LVFVKVKLQTKVFAVLAGLTTFVSVVIIGLTTFTLNTKLKEKIGFDFNQHQKIFQNYLGLEFDRLVEAATLIGENSTFKANVELNDPPSVQQSVREFARFTKVDLFVVTDKSGTLLGEMGLPKRFGNALAFLPSIKDAMSGKYLSDSIPWPILLGTEDKLFQISSVPIYAGDDIIGTITLGSEITKVEANKLKGETDIEVTFFLNLTPIGSTVENEDKGEIGQMIANHHPKVRAAVEEMKTSGPFETSLKGAPAFALITPLGFGAPAFLLARTPQSSALAILKILQKNLIIFLIFTLLFAVLFSVVIGRAITRPIVNLIKGMDRLKKGDFKTKVAVTTKDEIGEMTQTFNEMVSSIQEKIHLEKFVGKHTQQLVKDTGSKMDLGGTKKKMAVLFSDIRGFTAFSETRAPEEVIAMINRYLGFQAEIVTSKGGSVDKFVGDEMVALFDQEDGIERAIESSILIQKRARQENEKDSNAIHIGIGINFGPMVQGNMGSEERMDYTVIGAAVNLGARLCSAAKPEEILIPKSLLGLLHENYHLGESQKMRFKGFTNEIEIASLLSSN